MSWADPVIATALAALAERTATSARMAVEPLWNWNLRDVWLTRSGQSCELATLSSRPSMRDPSTPPRPGTAARD